MFVNVGEELTAQQMFTIMSAGVVDALSYTFTGNVCHTAVIAGVVFMEYQFIHMTASFGYKYFKHQQAIHFVAC